MDELRSRMTIKLVIPSEAQEQKSLVKWLSYHLVLRDHFCKIENEGKRTLAQGFHAKLMGLRPGVSDLFIYYPTKTYHGLFLEIKRNMNYPNSARKSDSWVAQENFISIVKSVGFSGQFGYGWIDSKRIIEEYLCT